MSHFNYVFAHQWSAVVLKGKRKINYRSFEAGHTWEWTRYLLEKKFFQLKSRYVKSYLEAYRVVDFKAPRLDFKTLPIIDPSETIQNLDFIILRRMPSKPMFSTLFIPTTNIEKLEGSEDEKMQQVLFNQQLTLRRQRRYHPSVYKDKFPGWYTCSLCGVTGEHAAEECILKGIKQEYKIKSASGIPRSQLRAATDAEQKEMSCNLYKTSDGKLWAKRELGQIISTSLLSL